MRTVLVFPFARRDAGRGQFGAGGPVISSALSPKFDAAGQVTAETIGHPRDFVKRQLSNAAMYGVQ
ncbi:MAG: hypothetical protein NTW28_10735 [Candidatus Solibacter sp.]|nr:hypothetical protein [Candidatus Solibacter sp.]